MYKNVLRAIEDISTFPVMAIAIFFVFFLILLIYVIQMDKKDIHKISRIPLDPTPQITDKDSVSLNGHTRS